MDDTSWFRTPRSGGGAGGADSATSLSSVPDSAPAIAFWLELRQAARGAADGEAFLVWLRGRGFPAGRDGDSLMLKAWRTDRFWLGPGRGAMARASCFRRGGQTDSGWVRGGARRPHPRASGVADGQTCLHIRFLDSSLEASLHHPSARLLRAMPESSGLQLAASSMAWLL
jgi:hypothetical protein